MRNVAGILFRVFIFSLATSAQAHAEHAPLSYCMVPDSVQVTGNVRRVTVEDPSSQTPEIVAIFGQHSRLEQVEEYASSHVLARRAKFSYERFGISSITWSNSDGKSEEACSFTYSDEGRLTSYYDTDASGKVLWKVLFDQSDFSEHPLSRRFLINLVPPAQLAEVTDRVDCRGSCTKTTLLIDEKVAGTWMIRRSGKGRVEEEMIEFPDLSFSRIQHLPDGSTLEHDFSSKERKHVFSKRDLNGRLLSSWVQPENAPGNITDHKYEETSSVKLDSDGDSVSANEVTNTLVRDFQGNWTERMVKDSGGVRTTKRSIEYAP